MVIPRTQARPGGERNLGDLVIAPATAEDAAQVLVLQRCCWVQEAIANETLDIPALTESLEEVREWLTTWSVWQVRLGHRLVGAVRARLDGDVWEIGRLMVAPDLAGHGLGRRMLAFAEAAAPASARRFALYTGARSTRNIAMYQRAGYQLASSSIAGAVHLSKPVTPEEAVSSIR